MSRAGGATSPQARELRRRLLRLLVTRTVTYVVAMALAAAYFELNVRDDLAELVASSTSSWIYVSKQELPQFWEQFAETSSDAVPQVIPQEDGGIAVRDLSAYHALRAMKWPWRARSFSPATSS